MDIGKYDFKNMSPEVFREFLRELQQHAYNWPNLYFAWEKEDGSLLMVGTMSTQLNHLLVHEINLNSHVNKYRISFGDEPEYSTVLYGISTGIKYSERGVVFDPVDRLAFKVSECKYVGFWEDPDVLMYAPRSFNRVIACGRWELAKQKIGIKDDLDVVISDAARRSTFSEGGNFSVTREASLVDREGVDK